jgi:hypothetical protein
MANVKEGEVILCPNCKDPIARVLENIEHRMMLEEGFFQGIQTPIQNGHRARCVECGTDWMRLRDEVELYTESGWK